MYRYTKKVQLYQLTLFIALCNYFTINLVSTLRLVSLRGKCAYQQALRLSTLSLTIKPSIGVISTIFRWIMISFNPMSIAQSRGHYKSIRPLSCKKQKFFMYYFLFLVNSKFIVSGMCLRVALIFYSGFRLLYQTYKFFPIFAECEIFESSASRLSLYTSGYFLIQKRLHSSWNSTIRTIHQQDCCAQHVSCTLTSG